MSLDSAQKAEIKTFVDELSNKKEQLTPHEQQVVVNAVKGYLDSDRDLVPKEETLIKKTAKHYNLLISVLACTIFGTIAALAWTTYKSIETGIDKEIATITQEAREDARKKNKVFMEETRVSFHIFQRENKEEAKETIDYAKRKTKEYKEYTDKLFRELLESYKKVQIALSRIEVTEENARKTTGGLEKTLADVDKTLTDAKKLNRELVKTTNNLNQKAELVEKYDGLFKTLENGNDQLRFEKNKNKNQYYFQVGELLFVWGKKKISNDGTTVVEIDDRRFSSQNEMTISVTGCDFKGKYKGYPYVKDIKQNGFTCQFVQGPGKHNYLEKKEFYYMVVGEAAPGS